MIYPLLLIIVLILALWRGWRKGFTYQLASLLGLAFGFVAARLLGDSMSEMLEPLIPAPESFAPEPFGTPLRNYTEHTAGASAVFVLVYIGFRMLGTVLNSAMQLLHTGAINSIAGAALNFGKWVLIMSVIFNLWLIIKPDCGLLKYYNDGDGNVVELVMEAAPALFGIPGPDELEHIRRMRQARAIESGNYDNTETQDNTDTTNY